MILDQAGDLVGTTENGGSALQGAVFAVTPGTGGQATERLIHEFSGETDGTFPQSGLTADAAAASSNPEKQARAAVASRAAL